MAKVKLRATGGLNKDVDQDFLPEGDYISASNIVTDTSSSGGAGSIKMLESITSTGVSFFGNIKATCQDPDGNIYVLERVDNTNASIHKLTTTTTLFDTKTTVLTYAHAVSSGSDFDPDLKILGDVLMWNYREEGTLLSYNLTSTGTPTLADLLLQKETPNIRSIVIEKHKTTNGGVGELESKDFQFAFRYLYKSGEYSALSAYTQMYKAEKDTDYYSLTYPSQDLVTLNFQGAPTYVDKIETYVREGNNGAWLRIDSRTSADNLSPLYWTGAVYDALDTLSSSKPFDSIPVNAKHLEVAKNRLFLANVLDDYTLTDENLNLQITANPVGFTPASGGTDLFYGLTNINSASSTSTETSTTGDYGSGYVKPFCNDSTYAIGFAYYDAAMKTRGVEKFTTYNTGKFSQYLTPIVQIKPISGTTYTKPSWAKYIQVVYTKNLSKLYSYEGYASNVFFRVEKTTKDSVTGQDTKIITDIQNLTASDLNNNPVLVVDLSSMFSGDHLYNYVEGDKISINIKNYNTSTSAIYNLDIVGQEGSLIFCEYNDGEINVVQSSGVPQPELLYFEIYSQKQNQESESYVFYEYGNIVDISSWNGTDTLDFRAQYAFGYNDNGLTIDTKIIGDMVFKNVEAGTYSTAPFITTSQKTYPIESNTARVTTTATGSLSSFIQNSVTSVTTSYTAPIEKRNPPFLAITANGDGASLVDSSLQLSGFYESGSQIQNTDKITLTFSYNYNYYFTATSASMRWKLKGQLYRIPFDNQLNKRLEAQVFGNEFTIETRELYNTTASTSGTSGYTQTIDLNTTGIDINASDQFTLKVWSEFNVIGTATIAYYQVSNPTTGSFVTMSIVGKRITPQAYTVRDTNAALSTVKKKFLMRAISNAVSNEQWHTSAGKTSISSKDIISTRRTNTLRYSGQYIAGTKINDLNSFSFLDSTDLPVENGEIMALHRTSRLQGNGDMLLALCKRESSYILLGEQDLTQASNAPLRALTANFIGTTRNIGGNLGLQEKRSAIHYRGSVYWWDDFTKKVIKFSKDGIEILSDVFMKSYFRGKSGAARLCYDPFYNTINVGFTSDTYSTGFSEVTKRWISDYSFITDFSESFGDKMILFKGTATYRSLGANYNAFLGATAADSTIQFVINSQVPVQPLNVAVQHNCNVIDYTQSNGVKASLLTIGITNENGQSTSIVESNFLLENNRLYAHVLRDANSPNGIVAGDHIVGYINKFLLTLKDKSQQMRINSIDVEVDNVSGHS